MTTLTLSRPHISQGALAEYENFATLVESLSENDWSAPTRCTGFQVRDVAGHVIGLAEDVAAGVPGSRTAEEEAASVRHETPAGAAARLRVAMVAAQALLDAIDDDAWTGPSGLPDLSLGEGVLLLWYDAYVHIDDINAATGRPSVRGPGLDASLAYVTAQLATRGWSGEVTCDELDFVLAATGRTDPAPLGLDASVNIYAE
jgi:uncharacterized protein (TIGR03083 family)